MRKIFLNPLFAAGILVWLFTSQPGHVSLNIPKDTTVTIDVHWNPTIYSDLTVTHTLAPLPQIPQIPGVHGDIDLHGSPTITVSITPMPTN